MDFESHRLEVIPFLCRVEVAFDTGETGTHESQP